MIYIREKQRRLLIGIQNIYISLFQIHVDAGSFKFLKTLAISHFSTKQCWTFKYYNRDYCYNSVFLLLLFFKCQNINLKAKQVKITILGNGNG